MRRAIAAPSSPVWARSAPGAGASRPLREGLRSGRTAIGPFERFDHSRHRTHVAGEVPEGPPPDFARGPRWPRLSLADRFAVFAAREALAQAGLDGPLDERAAGVYFASSTGGMLESERYFTELVAARAPAPARPDVVAADQRPGDAVARAAAGSPAPCRRSRRPAPPGALALEPRWPRHAHGRGGRRPRRRLRLPVPDHLFRVQRAARGRRAPCRPFREGRAGMSLGEGAGVLVLERSTHALARGARAAGRAAAAPAPPATPSHMTAPHPEGAGAARGPGAGARGRRPRAGARWTSSTPTAPGRRSTTPRSARRFKRAFGPRARRCPLTATKGVVGHLLGSSGAIEAVATVLCLRDREVHPTPGGGRVGSRAIGARSRPRAHRCAVPEARRGRLHEPGLRRRPTPPSSSRRWSG